MVYLGQEKFNEYWLLQSLNGVNPSFIYSNSFFSGYSSLYVGTFDSVLELRILELKALAN